jgi:glycosyltransferase involved in cell wall biosynthesis
MLKLLKTRDIELNILLSDSAERGFRSEVENLDIATFTARGKTLASYPDLEIEEHKELIESSDIVWITDIEYLVAPRIKRIKKDLPIIGSLRSYALMCPIWTALYGTRQICTENCSHSLPRFAQCKQASELYLAQWHYKSKRMKAYQLLNFPRSYLDFAKWPMNTSVVESIDGFHALSEFARDLARTHVPHLADLPIEVIPNPVIMPNPELASSGYENGDEAVLYASGAGIIKGPHIALYATRKLLDEGSHFTLVMLKTQTDNWIRTLVKRLHLENQVKLLPAVSKSQVSTLMARSKLVIMPSLYPETFGRIPVEANLLGVPAVVSTRGALPSVVVDKVTGLVTEPSVDAFAMSIHDALNGTWNRELITRITKERFNPERIIDDFIHFLNTFI